MCETAIYFFILFRFYYQLLCTGLIIRVFMKTHKINTVFYFFFTKIYLIATLNEIYRFFLSRSDPVNCYNSQDGRAVQGAAFRSQSGLPGVGSNPTSDNIFHQTNIFEYKVKLKNLCVTQSAA